MIRTELCERLGIDLPIVQAPIGRVSSPELAAAVSNAGGLGIGPGWSMRSSAFYTRELTTPPLC